VILVEGESDRCALEALAERRGRDLAAEAVAVVAIGGAQAIGRFLRRYGPAGLDLRLAGICDAGEEWLVRRGLEQAGLGSDLTRADMERLGFFVCTADLEDELIRAHGAAAVERVLEAHGDLGPFRTMQKQPAWRDRPPSEQLRRFMGSGSRRKIRYGRYLVESLELERMPRALEGALAHVDRRGPSAHYAHVMTQLIDSDDCVLVLVDVQPGFAERIEPQTRDGILERIAFLATAARFCGVPIVASVESPERYGDLHPAVRRAAGDVDAIRKQVFGLAGDPLVGPAVRAAGRGTAVLTGFETDVCVSQSALGLLDELRVVVVEDAVGAPGAGHGYGLDRMRRAGVRPLHTKGLFYEWMRTVERSQAFDAAHPDAAGAGVEL